MNEKKEGREREGGGGVREVDGTIREGTCTRGTVIDRKGGRMKCPRG